MKKDKDEQKYFDLKKYLQKVNKLIKNKKYLVIWDKKEVENNKFLIVGDRKEIVVEEFVFDDDHLSVRLDDDFVCGKKALKLSFYKKINIKGEIK